jgi:pimeloyl-ACP methyl ester carboxylesterase
MSSIQGIQNSAAIAIAALLIVLGFFSVIPSTHAATLDSQLDSSISPVVLDPSFGFYQPIFGETSGHSDTVAGFTVAFSSVSLTYMAAMLWECISPLNIATESCAQVAVDSSRNPPSGNIPASDKEELVFTFPIPYTLNPSNYYYIYAGAGDFYPPNTFYGSSAGTHFYDGGGGVCGPGPHDRCHYSLYYQLFGVGGPDAPPSDFNPIATTTPPCTENCNSNVLFLPGIEASRLYAPGLLGENRLWEPDSLLGNDISSLDMINSDFVDSVYTKQNGIVDTAYKSEVTGYDVYSSFIGNMDGLVAQGIIADWKPIAYDWRLDYQDLLMYGHETNDGKIYYRGANAATSTDPYIIQELKKLAASSRTGKVTIVAHSNGGLLAKQILAYPELVQYVDKLILVASPQLGTPQAIGVLLHGYNQALPKEKLPIFLSDADARSLGKDMPMAYNLLPSDQYFNYTQNAVITFDPATMADWKLKYTGPSLLTNGITTSTQLKAFMTDASRVAPGYYDLATPSVASSTLFSNAVTVHDQLDNWTPPAGVQLITIAGWGSDTLASIEYKKVPKLTCLVYAADSTCSRSGLIPVQTYDPKLVIDGDGTVVESSAQWVNGALSTRYWVNLMALNTTATSTVSHANILETPAVQSLLAMLMTNASTSTLPQFISASRPVYAGDAPRLHFILHSPLTLGFTDAQGNYTGSTTTISNIPGVVYERFGEVQWLSVPKSLAGQVIMHGTGSGSFALDIQEVNGNNTLATTTFAAIPSGTSTIATLTVDPNTSPTASSTLTIDYDGNGTIDTSYQTKQGEVVISDITPPITTLVATGTAGMNGWYTSDVALVFNAIDTESGVAETFLSLDGAATSTATTTTISTDGIHTLAYYSIDNAGNQEIATTTIIKIDKTFPEARIMISTSTKDLSITGLDTMSSTTVSKTATSTEITDEAGNVTKLVFQRTYSGKVLTYARLLSIQYGVSSPITLPTSFLYVWNPFTNPTTLISQTITVDKTYLIQALYNKPKNKTTIIVLKKNTPTQREMLSGLVPIALTTSQGAMEYSW